MKLDVKCRLSSENYSVVREIRALIATLRIASDPECRTPEQEVARYQAILNLVDDINEWCEWPEDMPRPLDLSDEIIINIAESMVGLTQDEAKKSAISSEPQYEVSVTPIFQPDSATT